MKVRLLALLGCFCAAAGPVRAQAPLTDRIPGETLVYASWSGRSLVFDGSVTGQMLNEPAVAKCLGAIKALIEAQAPAKFTEAIPQVWSMAATAWQHPIAFGLIDLKPGQVSPDISAAVLIELGRDRQAFASQLDALIPKLISDEITITEATVGDVTYRKMDLGDGEELSLGFIGDVFFLCLGSETPKQLIELAAEKALSAGKKFVECHAAVGGENEQFTLYVDVPSLLDRAERLSAAPADEAPTTRSVSQIRKLLAAMGMEKITAAISTTRIVDRGMYTKTRIFTPAPHRGILMPLAGQTLTDTDLVGVPEDADFLLAARLSPQAAWTELRRCLVLFSSGTARDLEQDFVGKVEEIEKEIGISITDDVLGSLGDTIVLSSAPSHGGFITGTLLKVPVKDVEKLSAAIEKIEQHLTGKFAAEDAPQGKGMNIEKITVGRTEIHYLAGFKRIPWPIAPAWAIHKDSLYLALWPQVAAAAIATADTARPLTAQAGFRKTREKVSAEAAVLAYADTYKIVHQLYPLALVGWTTGANALSKQTPIKPRPDWLPPLPTLAKYLWPSIRTVHADANGITIEDYGSLPDGFINPLARLTTFLPSLNRARSNAKKAVSAANLDRIGQGIALYEAEHGELPADLSVLVQEEFVPTNMLVSPLSGRPSPRLVGGELVGEVDYIYLRSASWEDDQAGKLIMAYERPENYRGKGTNVLFADGHVEFMTMSAFQQAMELTKDRLKSPPTNKDDF